MIRVGFNYGDKGKCPLCTNANDDQQHLSRCPELTNDNDTQYTEIALNSDNTNANSDWDTISTTIKRLQKAIRRREVIVEERNK